MPRKKKRKPWKQPYTPELKAQKKERYRKNKLLLASLKEQLGGKCVECGSTGRLEFDHIDREQKLFALAQACLRSEVAIIAEAAKCRLLCRTCHWARTSAQHANGEISRRSFIEPESGIEKICRKCLRAKDSSLFYKDERATGGRQHVCKECESARAKALMDKNRAYIASKKTACAECGETTGLEFDHTTEKYRGVAMMVGYSRKRIDAEIAKCVVLCTACHMARTEQREFKGGRPKQS